MTTYSLRSASPAKTRADAVVVGVVAGDKGPRLCDAADDVSKAYGRRLRPFLSTMGVTGKAGEAVRAPSRDEVNAPLLVEAGSRQFTYPAKDGAPMAMAYWSLPESALDDPDEAADWARKSIDAALRKAAARTPRKPKSRS